MLALAKTNLKYNMVYVNACFHFLQFIDFNKNESRRQFHFNMYPNPCELIIRKILSLVNQYLNECLHVYLIFQIIQPCTCCCAQRLKIK